jgi:hypothetical protein
MGFLSKLFPGSAPPAPSAPFRSTLEADATIGATVVAMKQGNIQPALQLYHAATADPELRLRLVHAAALHFGNSTTRTMLVDAWVKNTPADPFAALVRARWRIKSAPRWYPNDKKSVADAARQANRDAAEFARSEYERIAQASPNDPVPWALLLNLPLVFKLEELRKLYDRVQDSGSLFDAHLSMLHWLSPMWYGNHGETLALARAVAERAAPGSELHVLLVYAHFNVYTYEKFYGQGEVAAKQIFADAKVTAEVQRGLEQSLASAEYRAGHYALWARHVAAAWFYEAGDKPHARAQLALAQDSFDEKADPWNLSASGYQQIRRQLGL